MLFGLRDGRSIRWIPTPSESRPCGRTKSAAVAKLPSVDVSGHIGSLRPQQLSNRHRTPANDLGGFLAFSGVSLQQPKPGKPFVS